VTVTLKKVAERAGVSIRTVSNVVNDRPYVSAAMRSRVQEVLDELGYRPNLAARNLRSGRSGMIALLVPELSVPYFTELTEFVIEEAAQQGYTVVVDSTGGDPERERQLVMSSDRAMLFDGLLFSPLGLGAGDLRQRSEKLPMVLFGERVAGAGLDHVTIDNVAAAKEATEHLLDLGCQTIAAIGDRPQDAIGTALYRTQGYRVALESAGHAIRPELMQSPRQFHREDGAELMSRLLDLEVRPDGVFCYNDLLAIGAIRTAYERGIRVPEDVAIVGFDDTTEGRFTTPTLTSISPDKRGLARVAVERLLARLAGDTSEPVERTLGYSLIVRESTAGRKSSS
jgi:DNA-binding LacI/PurR family transcriptional regulator